MPSANRQEQINRWFHKHILSNQKAHKLLMEAVPGDDRWIKAVHKQNVPKYFKDPAKWRLFKHGLRKLALPIWEARDAANSQRTDGKEENRAKEEDTTAAQEEDDTSTVHQNNEE